MHAFLRTTLIVVLVPLVASAICPRCEAVEVRVSLTLKDDNGKPIAGLPLTFLGCKATDGGRTDEQGKIERMLDVGEGEHSIRVDLFSYYGWITPPTGETALQRKQFHDEFRSKYSFEEQTSIPIQADRTAHAEIVAYPAVEVGCSFITQEGQPMQFVGFSASSWFAPSKNGKASVRGFRKGHPIRLFARFNDGRVVEHAAGPFEENTDIGSIPVDQTTDAKLQVTFVGDDAATMQTCEVDRGITIVSMDGKYVKTARLMAIEDHSPAGYREELGCLCNDDNDTNGLVCLPQGEYWILPGTFFPPARSQITVLDMIRAGKPLGDAGMRVTAVAGQTTPAIVDLPKLNKGWAVLDLR